MDQPLRVCRTCGKKAWTTEDLEEFVINRSQPYERSNWCKSCMSRFVSLKAQSVKGSQVYHKETKVLRETQICSICGRECDVKEVTDWRRQQKNQVTIHHPNNVYHKNDPMKGVKFVCGYCHPILKYLEEMEQWNIKTFGSNYKQYLDNFFV